MEKIFESVWNGNQEEFEWQEINGNAWAGSRVFANFGGPIAAPGKRVRITIEELDE